MKQTRKTLREKKNRLSYLIENELEKAEMVIAIKAITDKLQDMAEDLAKVEADDIMPMSDSLKTAFGPQLADQFSNTATEKVRELVTAISTAKDAIGNEISRLEKSVNGEPTNDMAMSDADDMDMNDDGSNENDHDHDHMDDELPPPEDMEHGSKHHEVHNDMRGELPPLNKEPMTAAGRAKKESATRRGRRLVEYTNGHFDSCLQAMQEFCPKCGALGSQIQDMIEKGRFNGEERKGLTNILSHIASCAADHVHWNDPDTKVEQSVRANRIDMRLPETREIIAKMKKLAHLIGFKHDGMIDEDMSEMSASMPTSSTSSMSTSSSIPSGFLENIDDRVLRAFRRLLKENIRPARAVATVASRYSIDASDVVAIVREAKKATRGKKKVAEFEMKPTPKSKRGMFKGVSQEELRSRLSNVKKRMKSHEDKGEKVPKELRSKMAQLQFALRAKHNWGKVSEAKMQDVIEADAKRLARKLKMDEAVPQKPKSPADLRADRQADAAAKAAQMPQGTKPSKTQNQQTQSQQPPAVFQKAPAAPQQASPAQAPVQGRPSVGTTPPGTNGQGQMSGQMARHTPVGKAPEKEPAPVQMPGKAVKTVPNVPGMTLMSKPNGPFPKPAGQLVGGQTPQPQQAGQVSEAKAKDKRKNDPCWKNYKMVGMKKKGGKKVPNCVPESKNKPARR